MTLPVALLLLVCFVLVGGALGEVAFRFYDARVDKSSRHRGAL
jgi:hypothetical protein